MSTKLVRVRNNISEQWVNDRVFIGISPTGVAVVEHKGNLSYFKLWEMMPQRKKYPMGIEQIAVLVFQNLWFKRGENGKPFINPCVQLGVEDDYVLVNGFNSKEIFYAENYNLPHENWDKLETEEARL